MCSLLTLAGVVAVDGWSFWGSEDESDNLFADFSYFFYLCRVMSEFIVSARKYRPATFASVVGQQSITSTLKNAIERGQLAHAYLF